MAVKILFWTYLLLNVATFILYGADKYLARRRAGRIPEKWLLLAAVPGAIGALFGMYLFRHKTRHRRFQLIIPLAVLVHAGAWILFSKIL